MRRPRSTLFAPLIGALLLSFGADARAQVRPTTAGAESMALIDQARELRQDGKNPQAAALYDRAISLAPDNEIAYLELSEVLFALSQNDRAVSILSSFLDRIRYSPAVATELGRHLIALGRIEEGEQRLHEVVEGDPGAFSARLQLGELYLDGGRFDEAGTEFEAYLSHRPEDLSAEDGVVRGRMAFAALRANQFARAEKLSRENLASNPKDDASRLVLFSALVATERCTEALAMFGGGGEALARKAPSVEYNRAACLRRSPATRIEALAALDRYQALRPADPHGARLRGHILVDSKRPSEALELYRTATANGMDLRSDLGLLLADLGRSDEALQTLQPLVEEGTKSPDVLSVVARTSLASKRYKDAHTAAERFALVAQDRPEAPLLLGHTLLALGRLRDAEASYRKALALAQPSPEARRGLSETLEARAKALALQGEFERAHSLLLEASKLDPEAPSLRANLALVELRLGRAKDAEQRLQTVSAPSPIETRLLARAYLASDQSARARALLGRREKSLPDGVALLERALSIREEEPRTALALLRRAAARGIDVAALETQTRIMQAERALSARSAARAKRLLQALPAEVPKPLATRVKVDLALAEGILHGGKALTRALAEIADDVLDAVVQSEGSLKPRQRIRLEAALLSGRVSARALALAKSSDDPESRAGLSAWYEQALFSAILSGDRSLANRLTKSAPASLQSPAFRHNAAVRTWPRLRTPAQIAEVEALASKVGVAELNLALVGFWNGDPEGTKAALERAKNVPSTRDLATEWLRWHEQLYGAQ